MEEEEEKEEDEKEEEERARSSRKEEDESIELNSKPRQSEIKLCPLENRIEGEGVRPRARRRRGG